MFPKIVLLLSMWAAAITFCAPLTELDTPTKVHQRPQPDVYLTSQNQLPIRPSEQTTSSSAEQEQSRNPDFRESDMFGLNWHTDWSEPGADPVRKKRLTSSFTGAMDLARAAAETVVDSKKNAFLIKKYLGEINEVHLKNMLNGMRGKIQGTGADRLKPLHWRRTDYRNTCNPPNGDRVMAYTAIDGVGKRAIVVCDRGFNNLRDLSAITCADLKWNPNKNEAILSTKMLSLASIVFHELMHANSEIDPQPLGDKVVDDLAVELPDRTKVSVYGPILTQYFAKKAPSLAKRNADNWAWLALEAYWRKKCPDMMFLDPKIPGAMDFLLPSQD